MREVAEHVEGVLQEGFEGDMAEVVGLIDKPAPALRFQIGRSRIEGVASVVPAGIKHPADIIRRGHALELGRGFQREQKTLAAFAVIGSARFSARKQNLLVKRPLRTCFPDSRGAQAPEAIKLGKRDPAASDGGIKRRSKIVEFFIEGASQRIADLTAGNGNVVFIRAGENADFKELAAIGKAEYAPFDRKVTSRAAGLRIIPEIDRLCPRLYELASSPSDSGNACFAAAPLRDERVKSLCAPDKALPAFGVGIADTLRIDPAQPRIKSVITDAQGHVADSRQQCLIQTDAAVLHTQRVETVLCPVLGPFGVVYPRSCCCGCRHMKFFSLTG